MAFMRTTAINKLLKMKARKKVVQGSTSAGKTYGIIPVIIDRAAKVPRQKITIVAETLSAVREGALDIFKNIMVDTSRWREEAWNASRLIYTFGNGTVIQFKSYDTAGKAKASGKRDILFLNEANHIKFDIADTLMIRSKEIWIDFNPDEPFWAHSEVLTEPNSEFLLLTYEDNEACPEETIEDLKIKMTKAFYDVDGDWSDKRNIKSAYWANWCRVYVKGEIGILEGVIFQNYEIVESLPAEAELMGFGSDFGKGGADPTTTTAYYWFDGHVYWDELVYQTQLRDSQHIALLNRTGLDLKKENQCDNSEPSKIQELKLAGINAKGPKKETIDYGIGLIQDRPFKVTARSLNIIKELRNYKYDDDGKPIDGFNHALDNARYFYVAKYGVNQKKKVSYKRG